MVHCGVYIDPSVESQPIQCRVPKPLKPEWQGDVSWLNPATLLSVVSSMDSDAPEVSTSNPIP